MLELCRVGPFDVGERGVGVHDALVAQVLKRHQVLGLPQAVKPAAAEGQGPEVLVHDVQELFGAGQPGMGTYNLVFRGLECIIKSYINTS